MSKAVLISIRPEWCKLIVDGKKTVEVRKSRPKLETPFKCYIYCTVGGIKRMPKDYLTECFEHGKVIGEFVCDRIDDIMISCSDQNMRGIPFPGTGLTDREIMDYIGNGKNGFGLHISDLVIYFRPKELSKFVRRCKAYGKDTGRCWDCSKSVGDEHDCGANGILEMKRPPQSWCYVEELEGEQNETFNGGMKMPDCENCNERCPKAEMAHEIALGRMYATNELVKLVKKIERGQLVEIGNCDGCMFANRKRPQKCSCCRRNRYLKDCYCSEVR